jgi:hypothetical protein
MGVIMDKNIARLIANSVAKEILEKIELVKKHYKSFNPDSLIVESLKEKIDQLGDVDLSTLIGNNDKTLLYLAVEHRGLWNSLSQEARNSLIEKSDEKENDYLHVAAKAKNIDAFLSIFKKSVESDVRLLEYNNDQENPFHIAAKMRILPDVVKGIFKYLESEQTNPNSDSKKLENVKSYVKDALGNRCALDKSKKTPLDWVSKAVRKEIKEIAGIKESLICNKKFRLCLYIVGAIACTAALCLSLYFLYLCSQGLALGSIAGIASGGVAYLSGKVYSEIYDLNSVSTLAESLGNKELAEMTVGA